MWRRSQKDTIKHYKSLNYIPMFNYYQAEETGDLRYLLKLDDYEELPDIDIDLSKTWESMRLEAEDEAIQRNKQALTIFNQNKTIVEMEAKYNLIQYLLPFLWQVHDVIKSCTGEEKEKYEKLKDEQLKALEIQGFKINPKRDYHQEIKRIEKQCKTLLTPIAVKKEDLKDVSKGEKIDIYTEIESIERYRNKDIDIHTTTMKKWLVIKYKVYNEINKKDGRSSK